MRTTHCQGCGTPLPVPASPKDHRRKWCSERCRKRQYDRECVDCGGRVDGTTPSQLSATPRCASCLARHIHDSRYWTPERVIEAIQTFAARAGRPPRAVDFNPAMARHRGQGGRVLEGRWPDPTDVVAREFGSWNDGIRAAGFEPFDHETDHTWAVGRPIYRDAA